MSGRPWERWQGSATQAQSDLPMQVAMGGSAASAPPISRVVDDLPAASDPAHDDWEQELAIAPAIAAAKESGLPSRVDGPGDTFRHLVWAAELTRKFGPEVASYILGFHEIQGRGEGQSQQAEKMDRYNNAIGIRIGQTARDYGDVLQRVESLVRATAPEGNGAWREPHHHSPHPAPQWLPREEWKGFPSRQMNWYDNPVRAQGLVFPEEWDHAKRYRFRGEQNEQTWPTLNALLGLLLHRYYADTPDTGKSRSPISARGPRWGKAEVIPPR